jgi:hypothetical protein
MRPLGEHEAHFFVMGWIWTRSGLTPIFEAHWST